MLLATWIELVGAGPAIFGAKLMAASCGVVLHCLGVQRALLGLTVFYAIAAIARGSSFSATSKLCGRTDPLQPLDSSRVQERVKLALAKETDQMRKVCVVAAAAILMLQAASLLAQNKTPLGFFITSVGSGDGANLGGIAAPTRIAKLAAAAGAGSRTWRLLERRRER